MSSLLRKIKRLLRRFNRKFRASDHDLVVLWCLPSVVFWDQEMIEGRLAKFTDPITPDPELVSQCLDRLVRFGLAEKKNDIHTDYKTKYLATLQGGRPSFRRPENDALVSI